MKNRKIRLTGIILILSAMLVAWKWSTLFVLELAEINYDITEKVLRYFVLGGVALMIVAAAVLLIKEFYNEHK